MTEPAGKGRKKAIIASAAAFAAAFEVSRETIEKLETYEALLRAWQKTINLVAPSTLDEVWHRHFADSAQLVPLAFDTVSARPRSPSRGEPALEQIRDVGACHGVVDPRDARTSDILGPDRLDTATLTAPTSRPLRWLDLGSGAGFPGLVVAILLAERPAEVTLIESDQRKAAFLHEVARRTGTVVDILSIRIEQAATQSRVLPADVVSARALAPLPRLLGLAAPFFGSASVGLFLKGRDVEAELAEARRRWVFDDQLVPSLTDEDARIVVIRCLVAEREVEP